MIFVHYFSFILHPFNLFNPPNLLNLFSIQCHYQFSFAIFCCVCCSRISSEFLTSSISPASYAGSAFHLPPPSFLIYANAPHDRFSCNCPFFSIYWKQNETNFLRLYALFLWFTALPAPTPIVSKSQNHIILHSSLLLTRWFPTLPPLRIRINS